MTILDEVPAPDGSPDLPPLLLRRVTDPATSSAAVALLDGTVPPPEDDLSLLVLVDPAAGPDELPAAAALLVPLEPDLIELRSFGTRAGLPPAEVADRLLAAIADWLRAAGCPRLVGPSPARTRPEVMTALSAAGFTVRADGRAELSL